MIQTSHTLVSAGTEHMLVEFGKAGWIDKARQQPDKVRMVLDKIKTDGLQPTLARKLWPRRLIRRLLPGAGLFMLIEARK